MAIPTVRVRTICEVSHTVDGGGWDGARRGHPDRAPRAPTTTVTATTTAANALLSVSAPPHSGSTARTSHTISHRALGRAQPVTQLRYLTAAAQLRYYFGARSALTRSSVSAASVSLWRASTRSKMDAIHVPLHSSACFLAFSNLLKFCATCGRRRGRGRARALLNVTPHDAE